MLRILNKFLFIYVRLLFLGPALLEKIGAIAILEKGAAKSAGAKTAAPVSQG